MSSFRDDWTSLKRSLRAPIGTDRDNARSLSRVSTRSGRSSNCSGVDRRATAYFARNTPHAESPYAIDLSLNLDLDRGRQRGSSTSGSDAPLRRPPAHLVGPAQPFAPFNPAACLWQPAVVDLAKPPDEFPNPLGAHPVAVAVESREAASPVTASIHDRIPHTPSGRFRELLFAQHEEQEPACLRNGLAVQRSLQETQHQHQHWHWPAGTQSDPSVDLYRLPQLSERAPCPPAQSAVINNPGPIAVWAPPAMSSSSHSFDHSETSDIDILEEDGAFPSPAPAIQATTTVTSFGLPSAEEVIHAKASSRPPRYMPAMLSSGSSSTTTTALLIVDMQNFFASMTSNAQPHILKLAGHFTATHQPILVTQHGHSREQLTPPFTNQLVRKWGVEESIAEGSREWALQPPIDALVAQHKLPIVAKSTYDSFYDSQLESMLRDRRVERVVVCGVMTDCCVDTTARSAFNRGFETWVVSDACASANRKQHEAGLEAFGFAFGEVLETEGVVRRV